MFRLVCLDVDGTLVDTNMRIPPQVVKALIRLQTRGILITLASGRHIPSLQKYARLIKVELLGYYKEHYPADYEFVLSGDRYLEVVDKHATKGQALQTVAQHLRISRSEIMAVGDHYNDVSMLEYAGFGVAMGNAPAVVQQKADWVTTKNTERGILKALACTFGQI